MRILLADGSTVYKDIFIKAMAEIAPNADVAHAKNGKGALELIKKRDYDIVVLDIEIKEPDAPHILNEIIKVIPKALVIITVSPSPAHNKLGAELLTMGAFDTITKPIYDSYSENIDKIKQKMTEVLDVVTEKHAKKSEPAENKEEDQKTALLPELVLIAVSTGGPQTLQKIFSEISGDIPVPILVVQHIPANFAEVLAGNLNLTSKLKVKVAETREKIEAGTVYIAPGDIHMKLDKKNKIYFDDSPPIHGIRPAADVLFESVVESYAVNRVLVIILTGMGSDGVKGLKMLKKERVCYCIAQSESTCVVYGMPRVAVESGLVDKIVDLEDIASEIEELTM